MFNSLDTSSLLNFDQTVRRVVLPVNPEQTQPIITNANNQSVDEFVSAGSQDDDLNERILLLRDPDASVRLAAVRGLRGYSQVVPALIDIFRRDPDQSVRLEAVRSLGYAENSLPAERALITALINPNADIRREAAISLGHIGISPSQTISINPSRVMSASSGQDLPQVISALVTALRGDTDLNVRREAAISLGNLGNRAYRGTRAMNRERRRLPEAEAGLIAALREDADLTVRREAARSLGNLGDCSQNAETALTTTLLEVSTDDLTVRLEAARSLGQLRATSSVVSALMTALRAPQATLREEAAYALGRLGDRVGWGLSRQLFPQAIPALIAALNDSNLDVRVSVVHALGSMGEAVQSGESPEAAAALIRVFRDPNSHPRMREAAIYSLSRQPYLPEAVIEIGAALSDRDPEVVAAAVYAFNYMQPYRIPFAAQNSLVRFINNNGTSEEDRNSAIRFLCSIARVGNLQRTDEQFRIFTNALRSTNEDVSNSARRTLVSLEGASVPHIVEQFGNGVSSETLLNMLVEIGPPAVNNLAAALEDGNLVVRANSAQALAQIGNNLDLNVSGNQRQLNGIVESIYYLALLDPNHNVREAACNALGSIGTRASGALSVLEIIAENDLRANVRLQAQTAIQMIRGN